MPAIARMARSYRSAPKDDLPMIRCFKAAALTLLLTLGGCSSLLFYPSDDVAITPARAKLDYLSLIHI